MIEEYGEPDEVSIIKGRKKYIWIRDIKISLSLYVSMGESDITMQYRKKETE